VIEHYPIPGNEHASEYHNLIIGAVEFLFFPQLIYPWKEHEIHEGRKRIDMPLPCNRTTSIPCPERCAITAWSR
jgi:hypothetical protein